jgi:hypothetical protein
MEVDAAFYCLYDCLIFINAIFVWEGGVTEANTLPPCGWFVDGKTLTIDHC